MMQLINKLLKHPLIHGSAIIGVGGIFASLFLFFFNIFMLQKLTPADYGILATIIAIIGYPATITAAFGPLIIRFAGEYFATGKTDYVRGLYIMIFKAIATIAIIVFILFHIFIPQISNFFHINDQIILEITNFIIFFTFISMINIPFIQAKLAFKYQLLTNLTNAVIRFGLGVLLVLSGLAAKGAVLAILFAAICSYIVSFIPLKFIFNRKIISPPIKTQYLYKYGIPSAITLLSLNSFIATDIILVKHFFDPYQAGLYSGLSVVSRVIFFLLIPISQVMFPIIVQKHAKNENYTNTFKLSLFLVFFPSIILTIFYSLFPQFTILFFTGGKTEYLAMSPLVGYFGFFVSLYTVLNIVTTFYLSIKKTKIVFPVTIGALLQLTLIYFYHDSFFSIIIISLSITFLLVAGLLLYYPHATKK